MENKRKERIIREAEYTPLPKLLLIQSQWTEDKIASEEVLKARMKEADEFGNKSEYNKACVEAVKAKYSRNSPKAFNASTSSIEGFLYYELGVTRADVRLFEVLQGLAYAYISLSIDGRYLAQLEDEIALQEADIELLSEIRAKKGREL